MFLYYLLYVRSTLYSLPSHTSQSKSGCFMYECISL